jgi:hypothetical protein
VLALDEQGEMRDRKLEEALDGVLGCGDKGFNTGDAQCAELGRNGIRACQELDRAPMPSEHPREEAAAVNALKSDDADECDERLDNLHKDLASLTHTSQEPEELHAAACFACVHSANEGGEYHMRDAIAAEAVASLPQEDNDEHENDVGGCGCGENIDSVHSSQRHLVHKSGEAEAGVHCSCEGGGDEYGQDFDSIDKGDESVAHYCGDAGARNLHHDGGEDGYDDDFDSVEKGFESLVPTSGEAQAAPSLPSVENDRGDDEGVDNAREGPEAVLVGKPDGTEVPVNPASEDAEVVLDEHIDSVSKYPAHNSVQAEVLPQDGEDEYDNHVSSEDEELSPPAQRYQGGDGVNLSKQEDEEGYDEDFDSLESPAYKRECSEDYYSEESFDNE